MRWESGLAKPPSSFKDAPTNFVELVARYELRQAGWLAPSQEAYRAAVVSPPCVYALSRTGRLYVYELPSGAARPLERPVKVIPRVGDGNDVELIDDHLVFTNSGGLRVYSLVDKLNPRRVKTARPAAAAYSQTLVRAQHGLFVIGAGYIGCFDVSNVQAPRLVFEDRSSHFWWGGCVVGSRLCVAEISMELSATTRPVAQPREGVAIFDILPDRLVERGFVATPSPFHLFALDETHVLACLDSESLTHAGAGPHGRSTIINIADAAYPVAGNIEPNSASRAAAMVTRKDRSLLICEGAALTFRGHRMGVRQKLNTRGSTLDGAPYHGKVTGNWAVLPLDHELNVFKIDSADESGLRPAK